MPVKRSPKHKKTNGSEYQSAPPKDKRIMLFHGDKYWQGVKKISRGSYKASGITTLQIKGWGSLEACAIIRPPNGHVRVVKSKIRQFQRQVLDHVVRHASFLRLDRRAEFITKLFENDLKPQSRVLDIGGGWGFYKGPLEKRNHLHAVLEVVRPGYQRAPVILYDPMDPFPFADKSFDSSLIVTALHHMPDPAAVLKEAKRVTRDCVIVVEDIYRHGLGRLWTILRDQIYNLEFFGHPCQFRKTDQWLEMFRHLGFTVQRHQEIYTWMAGMRILNGVFILKVT